MTSEVQTVNLLLKIEFIAFVARTQVFELFEEQNTDRSRGIT